MTTEYDQQKDIAAEGQRAALYHGEKSEVRFLDGGDYRTKLDDLADARKTIGALVAALEKAQSEIRHLGLRASVPVTTGYIDAALALARGGK